MVTRSIDEHPKWRPCISYGCAGCAAGAYALEVVDLPRGVFQGNPFAQNVNRYGFRWDLSPSNGYFSIHELNFPHKPRSQSTICLANSRLVAGSIRCPIQMPTAHNLGTTVYISSQTRCFTGFLSLVPCPCQVAMASKLPHHR